MGGWSAICRSPIANPCLGQGRYRATDQANGSSAMGRGMAPTDNEAVAIALRYCSKYGGHGSDCVVRVQAWDAR